MEPATVETSPTLTALAAAMAKAQAELKNPPKDSVNPHFKSKYADLATVRDAVIPVLAKHGLAVMQLPCELGTDAALTTLLTHTSGEWIKTTMRLREMKHDPQGVGSALTYARRYALQSVAGVAADEDDDGNAGSRPPQQQQQKPQPQPAPQAPWLDSVDLTRSFIDRYGKVKSRNEVTDLDIEVGQAKTAGKLTVPQLNTIRLAAEGARKSFPVPAKT